jgi:type II secretory pathway pseudopilin PulG
MNRRRPRRRAAFTMIELLVVIGIIVVLIGLLVPVISKVKTTAATANVTNQMHRISAAIGNYYNDFQAYPGVLANRDFTPSVSLSAKLGNTSNEFPSFANYTQSEDLVMALRGGFRFDNNGKLDLHSAEMGLGPMSFNAAIAPRKHPYIDPVPAEYPPLELKTPPPLRSINYWANPPQSELPALAYVMDSEAPEFMDLYSSPRPILYLRANPTATPGNIVYNSKSVSKFDPSYSYDFGTIRPYLNGTTDFAGKDANDAKVQAYFTAPGGNAARNAGTYLLLDAGPDRIFGTDDDIIVGAGGGQ